MAFNRYGHLREGKSAASRSNQAQMSRVDLNAGGDSPPTHPLQSSANSSGIGPSPSPLPKDSATTAKDAVGGETGDTLEVITMLEKVDQMEEGGKNPYGARVTTSSTMEGSGIGEDENFSGMNTISKSSRFAGLKWFFIDVTALLVIIAVTATLGVTVGHRADGDDGKGDGTNGQTYDAPLDPASALPSGFPSMQPSGQQSEDTKQPSTEEVLQTTGPPSLMPVASGTLDAPSSAHFESGASEQIPTAVPSVRPSQQRSAPSTVPAEGLDLVPEILSRIVPPSFPDEDFDVTKFGAVGDGEVDSTAAFRDAIEACSTSGGGRVMVPPGTYATGPLRLMSGVNLHLSEGATIQFDKDPSSYLPLVLTRFEGVELMNYSPLVYAFEQENIAITGSGVLDGGADSAHWWDWKEEGLQNRAGRKLFAEAEMGRPVEDRRFGEGHYLRPSFIQPYRCHNVLIEGITIIGSPMWVVHPVLSTNVVVRGITVLSRGKNNDGCNPESCTDVLIEDCIFDVGDDCVAVKSGRNSDGRRVNATSSDIVIRNVTMSRGQGGVTVGSEMSGGVRNVFAENIVATNWLRTALRIKTNSVRGGVVENVYLRNIYIQRVRKAAVGVTYYYGEGDKGVHAPLVRNVEVRNLTCQRSTHAIFLRGYERAPIRDVRLINVRVAETKEENVIEHVEGLIINFRQKVA